MNQGYRIPFQGKRVIISQGYNGPYSHRIRKRKCAWNREMIHDDRYSLDFALPLNTPVLASREGRVLGAEDGHEEYYSGLDLEKGLNFPPNLILIKHNDGSFVVYAHLKKDSIRVEYEQRVKTGQVIAETGLSGWIGRVPHLHFAAFSTLKAGIRRSFPITFEDFDGPLEHSEILASLRRKTIKSVI